jgi:hypothetical protein
MASKINQGSYSVIRILRCRATRRYFTGEGWSENPDSAQLFPDEFGAVRACVSSHLDNVELVLRVDGSQTDLFCTQVR